jgi:hypothetical protein
VIVVSESLYGGQKSQATEAANLVHRGTLRGELWRGCSGDGAACAHRGSDDSLPIGFSDACNKALIPHL